jgi:Uma2 family endonuclease
MVMMADKPGAPADFLLQDFLLQDFLLQDFLLQDFLKLDTPEGYRAELVDGEIVVTPPPDGSHEDIIGLITKQIYTKSAVAMDFAAQKGLIVPSQGVNDEGRVIPGGTIAPAELRLFRGAPPWMPADGVTMVLEVTSSRPEIDRGAKRRAYAGADIPLYLLVDRQLSRVTLFSGPSAGDYAHTDAVSFGGKLDLPKPFAFALDTSEFAD